MGVRLIPPTRIHPAVTKGGILTLRHISFLEGVGEAIAGLPEIIPDIADLSGPASAAANQAKINEILAAMRTAGLMV